MEKQIIIFTDLDGTLLDSHYSLHKAIPVLKLLKKKKIPLVICSSKTKTEIESYRKKLNNQHPFITENGGGIFIPEGYFQLQESTFKRQIAGFKLHITKTKEYYFIKLGASYRELRRAVQKLRSDGFEIKGFGDMSAKEVAKCTGLTIKEATMAKQRDFDEPFIFFGNRKSLKRLFSCIRKMGYNYTQGTFFHIMGKSDKGRAVEILKKLYVKKYSSLFCAALGDSLNDREMFQKVEYPVLVKRPNGSYDKRVKLKRIIRVDGIGPVGWNRAVRSLISSR
jgi:mannosyl-3-phosphoglycerate phosphatase